MYVYPVLFHAWNLSLSILLHFFVEVIDDLRKFAGSFFKILNT